MTALNADMVDSIFFRLAAVYGSRFTAQFPAKDADGVKEQWSYELREFAGNPGAIDYSLEHLPSVTPPTVLELRDVARAHVHRHTVTAKERYAPVTKEERIQALEILRSVRRPERQDPKEWARHLRARELAGERMTLYQRNAWREALRVSPSETDTSIKSMT
jgi:hypothetical protein